MGIDGDKRSFWGDVPPFPSENPIFLVPDLELFPMLSDAKCKMLLVHLIRQERAWLVLAGFTWKSILEAPNVCFGNTARKAKKAVWLWAAIQP